MLISDHAGRIANSSLRKYSTMPPQTGILDLSDLMRLFSAGPSSVVWHVQRGSLHWRSCEMIEILGRERSNASMPGRSALG
jgi:hypothetical protein